MNPLEDFSLTRDRFSDAFVTEAAKGCGTLAELQSKVKWPDFQALRRASDRLGLNLPLIRKTRTGAPRAAQAVPKPVGKGKPPVKGGVE